MALILTVDAARWRARLDRVGAQAAASNVTLLPVVKGNGYGVGRDRLVTESAARGWATVAVGTAHELASVRHDAALTYVVVLTPIVSADEAMIVTRRADAVPTVGSGTHIGVLARGGWHGPVVVKLLSSMRRYGVEPSGLQALAEVVVEAGMTVHAYGLHLPLRGDASDTNVAEARRWLDHLPSGARLQVSHLTPDELAALARAREDITIDWRVGTQLWLGDAKEGLQLSTDVIEVRRCHAGEHAGYRRHALDHDGHLVMLGAGTAHGVHALGDGRSPFHFAHQRLELLEPPHMHTSIVVVPDGQPRPGVGDLVDVQRPLTQTWVDRVVES